MRPFLINPTKRIFPASASIAASLATICSISLLTGSAVTLTTLLTARAAVAAAKTDPVAVRGEIVMWVPAGINAARVAQIATAANCDVVKNLGGSPQYHLLRLKGAGTTRSAKKTTRAAGLVNVQTKYQVGPPTAEVLAAITAIQATQPDALADPNYIRFPARQQTQQQQGLTPNDTFYGEQWDKRMINMPIAWRFQNGSRPVIVANIDTGFDNTHPDFFRAGVPTFVDRINTGFDFVTDAEGEIVLPPVRIDDPLDGHGTHTAGTMSAVTNNAEGVTGVAGLDDFGVNIRLLPIKGSTRIVIEGEGDDPDIIADVFFDASLIDGILQSVSQGAVAINMSLGGFGSSATEGQAIADAIRAGTLIVAATGNSSLSGDSFPSFPANYPNVIAVSAVDSQQQLTSYSNFGGNTTITAPGGDASGNPNSITSAAETRILSTFPRLFNGTPVTSSGGALVRAPGYAYLQGTSMACPQVTGAVALLAAAGATAAEIPGILVESATPLPNPNQVNLFTGEAISSRSAYGAGLLNVSRALQPRITLLGGERFGLSDNLGSSATDLGTTYFRNPIYDVRIGGLGNLVREISNGSGSSSFTYRLEEATTPTSPLQTINITGTSFPALNATESPFATRAFPLPVTTTRLGQNRYRASLILNYRGITSTQVQFFEVLDYNQPAGLTMFSVPFIPNLPAGQESRQEEKVLSVGTGFVINRYDPITSRYFRFQPSSQPQDESYARFRNQFHNDDTRNDLTARLPEQPLSYAVGNPVESLAPIGVGFWANLSESRVLDTDGTPATVPVAIPLFGIEDKFGALTNVSGWNMIGAPFAYPVNWSAVTVRQETPVGVRDYSLREAVDAEIINAQLVGWDVPSQSYFYNVAPDGQLLPFRAYWVRALRDCTIIVPPNRSQPSLTSRAVGKGNPGITQGEGWRVRLSASVAGDRDAENYLGQVRGATDSEDRHDVPKPPTGPSNAYVRFLNNDRYGRKAAFAYDMRSMATGRQKAEWTVAVGAGKGDTDVTVTWDGLRNMPSRSKLVLKDTVTGKVVSMNGRSSYTYKNTEAGATRLLTISLSTQNSAGPLQIRNVRTVASGGGRAERQGVNVRFALSQDADVQATVKTLSGKVINTLSGATRGVGQGDVLLRWNGRSREGSEVPSGPYILEITARTDEGETTTVKRPITYLQ